ncbi:C-Maf-inducing protein-like isoform X2 [Trichogramma pretiosum]|uniref:C-Maf-inducing protein-like isoform X2 n=1 Tax=Trichogramma pretiosum TaxID=7493 RepID=UPI000C71BF17|nr:C-Maf-inducing protein-like isoform X2 [Trichogramma pretiosum]
MYCFQNPFSRATRSVVGSPLNPKLGSKSKQQQQQQQQQPNGQQTQNGQQQRRGSEATSEDSGSSSIRYIDQLSEASSTDTLPGIRAGDFLDAESILSPGGPESSLASPTIVFTSDETNNRTNSQDEDTLVGSPCSSVHGGSTGHVEKLGSSVGDLNSGPSGTGKSDGHWRRKLLLRLRSTDSSNSEANSSSPSPASESSCLHSRQHAEHQHHHSSNQLLAKNKLSPRRRRLHGSASLLIGRRKHENAFSDYDDDDDDVVTCPIDDAEPEEVSSLPSSPAAPATVGLATATSVPVPYYGFLSVNGGAMRQESTSTSSPQLATRCHDDEAQSTTSLPDETSSLKEEHRASSTETVALKSLLKPDTGLEASGCLPVARSCPNLERQSAGFFSASGSSSPIPSSGPRFKPVEEGDIQVCYLNHARTLVSKILSSRFLRRWETHHLYLNDACLSSKTLTGFLQQPVMYSMMSEVYAVARWDPAYKYCLRIVLPDGSLLLQASNAYTRDQWYYSILWKKSIFKYQKVVPTATKEEVVLRELKALVDFALSTPLQDERVMSTPLEAVAKLLDEPNNYERSSTSGSDQEPLIISDLMDEPSPAQLSEESEEADRRWSEAILNVAAPLLERAAPPPTLARALARLAQRHPRSSLVPALEPAITRCLKHTVDFGKSPDMRKLLQVFIAALYENEDGELAIRDYVQAVHGPGSDCPHPRILPNLVSICVGAIFHRFEVSALKQSVKSPKKQQQQQQAKENPEQENEKEQNGKEDEKVKKEDVEKQKEEEEEEEEKRKMENKEESSSSDSGNVSPTSLPPLRCYLLVLNIASEYADWRPGLGALLQPVPFPEDALADKEVQESVLSVVMRRLGRDPRCNVHRVLLPVRELRPGWLHIAAPSSPACPDEGQLFGEMLTTLLDCCCRRKRFISSLLKQTGGACILLGVRGCDAAQEALCLMLEWRLLPNEEARLQVVSALQSTESGKARYNALCQRQRNLQELKGGPRKLTLPVRATDADVALLLGGGALGNLECLSLAFTSVTSACAEQLIKLPALRYLNLWATQFGDTGLQMISEHLQKLQVLNLCETPVSDKGISTLASLTNLRKLNLNSTKLSASTFEQLKKRLPALQEFDVRYTEAW